MTRGQRGSGSSNGGKWCHLLHKGRRGKGGRGEEGEDVFRCGSCDEKRGEQLKTRGGEERKRREVVEDCALFIPADTSETLIHLEKGISQVTTYLVAFARMHTRTTKTHDEHTQTHNCK